MTCKGPFQIELFYDSMKKPASWDTTRLLSAAGTHLISLGYSIAPSTLFLLRPTQNKQSAGLQCYVEAYVEANEHNYQGRLAFLSPVIYSCLCTLEIYFKKSALCCC